MVFNLLFLEALVPLMLGQFLCPGQSNCTCEDTPNDMYDIICPKFSENPTVTSLVKRNEYARVQCKSAQQPEDIELLSGLILGQIKSFSLLLCPLPKTSYKALMTSMGIPTVKSLQVKSRSSFSNQLTRQHLEGLPDLEKLILSSNSLTDLPEDLFHGLDKLNWLDLRENKIRLARNIFKPVPNLEVLELGSNNMTHLEPGIFRNLTKLRLLNLWGNRLHNLTRGVFIGLPSLESLDLNSNGLTTLNPDIFTDLSSLKSINLYANDFVTLPQGLFLNTPKLEKVQIHNNKRSLTTLPPGFLGNLPYLKEIYLHNCNISTLPPDLFSGSVVILNITLQKNLLTHIPPGIFNGLVELQEINLSNNLLAIIPPSLFSSQEKLVTLNLSHNKLTSINSLIFSKLNALQNLNLAFNEIHTISPDVFRNTPNLRTINLSHNKLSNIQDQTIDDAYFTGTSILKECHKLENIFLSHNNISEIFSDWRLTMVELRVLDLSHNRIKKLTLQDLNFLSTRQVVLKLNYNNITRIEIAENLALATTESSYNHGPKVELQSNPFRCDCNLYNLWRFLSNNVNPKLNKLLDLDRDTLFCREPENLKDKLIKDIDPDYLTCQIEKDGCPESCTCDYRPSDKGLVVNCSDQNLTHVPPEMPHDSDVLNHTNHTELILNKNRLITFPKNPGEGYERVTKLDLSFNSLINIPEPPLLTNLAVLELHNNNISRIETELLKVIQHSKNLTKISLNNNSWICDCKARDLLDFVHLAYTKIEAYSNMTCADPPNAVFSKMTVNDLCPYSSVAIGIGSAIIAVLGLLIGGMAAAYYRYQKEIKVWLYAHRMCLWFVTEEELDKDKIYDAFISYSHQDEDFVVDKLVPGLENGPTKFKLCLHYRDWIVGDFIPNQIARSVEESRRTIVILSSNFLESVWGRMEFRAAHSQALSEGRARVIVILYGDVGPTENLDPELKAYLSMNTYVKWGDPWFWDKLRYALPHPPELSRGISLISKDNNKRGKCVANGNDKIGLVNKSDANSTPLAVTTPPADSLIIDPLKTLSNTKPV